MRLSSVHPQNYFVTDEQKGNMQRQPNTFCTTTQRCVCLFILTIIVFLIMISGIVIPIVVTRTRNGNTSESQPISSTTEKIVSMETMANTYFSTLNLTEPTISWKSKDISNVTESPKNMTSNVNYTYNFGSTTTSDNTSVTNSKNDSRETSTAYTSSVTTMVSNTGITTNKPTTVSMTSKPTTAAVDTTTSRSMIVLNQKNDTIIGLYNTTAGEATGGLNGTYSGFNEMPEHAMDGLLTTKYLNFGHLGGVNKVVAGPGIGTGFLVIPSISNSTLACALQFATANDNSRRDPITVTLEGSNVTTLSELNLGTSWTLIYNGSTGIDATSGPGWETWGTLQTFSNNNKRFTSYRLLITSQRADADAVQYSEVKIMGYL